MAKLFANSGDPDQTPDLGMHCLPITLLQVSQIQWAKNTYNILVHGETKNVKTFWLEKPRLCSTMIILRGFNTGIELNI